MLKFLVGAACIVVIAAGSYYLYNQVSQSAQASSDASSREECLRALNRTKEGRFWKGDSEKIGNCVSSGFISEAEFQAALHPKNNN